MLNEPKQIMGQAGSSSAMAKSRSFRSRSMNQGRAPDAGEVGAAKIASRGEQDEEEAAQQAAAGATVESPDDEGEAESGDSTLVLPDECLGLIFDRLDARCRNAASLVCRRWLQAEGSSRRILSLSAPSTLPISCLRSMLLLRFSTLSKLGLKCDRGVPSITDEALFVIATSCKQLSKLKLKNCVALTDSGLEAFAAAVCSKSFKSFSCCSCGFGVRGLNALIRHCAALEDLSIKKLRLGEPNDLVLGPSNLRRLSVKHIMDSGHAFAPLIAGSRQLHTLIIFKVSGHWDKLLEIVVDGLTDLTELRMEKIHLGDRGLQAVSKCRKLQVLFLARTPECSNAGIAAIANGCRSLRKLHVDGCFSGRIGDKGLISIAEKCPELKELVLIGLCATSDSLNVLFSNCTGLERLALWNSDTFGDRELSCIASKCRALRKLCIKCCPISDKGLEALATGCPSLSKVKIKKCRGVSAAGTTTLMMAHNGLVISLESEPTPVMMMVDANHPPPPPPPTIANLPVRAADAAAAASSSARSPFSRARSAIVAALGRVLT